MSVFPDLLFKNFELEFPAKSQAPFGIPGFFRDRKNHPLRWRSFYSFIYIFKNLEQSNMIEEDIPICIISIVLPIVTYHLTYMYDSICQQCNSCRDKRFMLRHPANGKTTLRTQLATHN